MARYIPDGKLCVVYAPAVSDKSAPTVAEVETAGIHLTKFLRQLDTPIEGTVVDIPDPTSRYNKTARGVRGGDPINADWYRDEEVSSDEDLAWDTLTDSTDGFLIIRRADEQDTGTGELASGDIVEVWPIEVVTRSPKSYNRNEPDGFSTRAAVPTDPEFDAAVVT